MMVIGRKLLIENRLRPILTLQLRWNHGILRSFRNPELHRCLRLDLASKCRARRHQPRMHSVPSVSMLDLGLWVLEAKTSDLR